MHLLFVVQRYGPEVFGGAEDACRQFASRMAVRHDVEVLTSCAVSYVDWANVYRPGTESLDGVTVASAGSVPTVLHPTAHDEPMLYLQLFDTTFRHPRALAFLTQEEAALV